MTGNILKAMISEISPTEQNEYHVISLVRGTKKNRKYRNRTGWWLAEQNV